MAREIPEFASGRLTLVGCEVKRLRSAQAEGYWTATYLLAVEGLSPGATVTVAAQGMLIPPEAPDPPLEPAAVPFATDGWQCYVAELRLQLRTETVDVGLPALALLTDPDEGRLLLERILRAGDSGYDDLRLAAVTPQLTAYKPGVRCTALCHLEYPADVDPRWPAVVVAKMHDDDAGERSFRTLRQLWESPLGRSEHVAIARPLAYDPALRLLVTSAIPEEQTLKDLLHSALLAETGEATRLLASTMTLAARGLAELHRCGVAQGPVVTWDDELAVLRKKRAKLAAVVPELDRLSGSVLERLETDAAATPADPLVPVHHSFRPAQVLVAGGRIGFIDFDKLCQSESASDLAMFLTKIRHAGLNKLHASHADEEDEVLDDETRTARIGRADEICEAFLTEYEKQAVVSRRRIALWEALELFSLVLSAAKKMNLTRVDNCAFLLEHHLQRHRL